MSAERNIDPPLVKFIRAMPKVELHLHLEGALAPATLLAFAERNGVDIPARDIEGVTQLFRYRTLQEFLTVFMALARTMVEPRDFEQAAFELGEQLAQQRVRYAEVMISPVQHLRRGVDLTAAVRATWAGMGRARAASGVQMAIIFDYGRQFGVDLAWEVLDIALACRDSGVVGWSIGGDEAQQPPEPFAEVYAAARAGGLRLMAHAGEVGGPDSVRGAIDALQVERIGHGIRSIGDPALVRELAARRITLDICPRSNLRTGAAPTVADIPLRQLYDAGVRLTINTDDPVFFETTMCGELLFVAQQFGFGADELCRMTLDAVDASFLAPQPKHELRAAIAAELTALRATCGV